MVEICTRKVFFFTYNVAAVTARPHCRSEGGVVYTHVPPSARPSRGPTLQIVGVLAMLRAVS